MKLYVHDQWRIQDINLDGTKIWSKYDFARFTKCLFVNLSCLQSTCIKNYENFGGANIVVAKHLLVAKSLVNRVS